MIRVVKVHNWWIPETSISFAKKKKCLRIQRIPPSSATPLLYIPFLFFPCKDFFHSWFFGFPFGPLDRLLLNPPLPQGSAHSQLTKRVKHYNYCRCWNVDPIFLIQRLPLGYICNTFLLATRQLFPSSAYFSSAADLMVREYALMLNVSQRSCAKMTQMI